jgi:methionyl-tRNA formyltransferase
MALAANKSSNGDISFKSRRVIFSKLEEVEPFRDCERFALIPGVPFIDGTLPLQPGEERGLYVFTKDGKLIRIREMKVEGEQVSDAVRAAHRAQMVANRPIHSADHRFFCMFYNPLH